LVYFNQPWLKVLVNHDIKAKNLEAHGVVIVIGLATSINMRHVGLSHYHSLDNYVLDLVHYSISVSSLLV
jgi:hypothetical protein